ncbi:MAG: hypothetical protein LBL45_05580 [Treponema sp.]|nr:hypothetical protein [Treponema sp.]
MKLKGCPFCGSKGAYVERLKLDAPNPYHDDLHGHHQIRRPDTRRAR